MSKKNKKITPKKSKHKSSIKKISSKKTLVKSTSYSHLISIIVILVITAFCFSTSLNNDFVNWDDDRNFYKNDNITQLSKSSFATQTIKIFKSKVIGNYNPLPVLTFAIEERVFGLDQPFYWHLNNLLLHLLCTFLVFRLCTLLKMNWRIAGIVSLLFGIHPLHVESVAWITERKDVLYGAFYLGALIQYVKYLGHHKTKHLVLIYLLFVLSLLSKIQAVSLPLSMLAIDYFVKRPIAWQRIVEKIPFFLISLVIGILAIFFLKEEGSLDSVATTGYPIWIRPFIGSYSFLIYLVKSIVPFRMSPMYPYPAIVPWYFYASMIGAPLYIGALVYAWKKEWRYVVFGCSFFIFNIVFLLQVLGAGQGFLADRFSYISFIGLFVMYAFAIDKYLLSKPKLKTIGMALLIGVTIGYGMLTYNQNKIWKNSGTLWTHVLKYYDNVTLPYGNRANYYRDNGNKKQAILDYNEAIRLDPNRAKQFNSRAKLFFGSNNPDTIQLAIQDYDHAIALDPEDAEYYINRGAGKARLNKPKDAIYDFNIGIRLDPNFANAYLNRSIVFNQLGEYESALKDLLKYQELNPYNANMIFETGRAYYRLSQWDNAINMYTKAIKMKANQGIFHYERAIAYERKGAIKQAKTDIQIAQSLNTRMNQEAVNRIMSQ